MFSNTVPEHLNANRFIDATEEITGLLEPQHYKRFAEMATLLPGGQATVRGSREPYGPRVVSGGLQCEANMMCQRCLQPVTVTLRGSIRWGLVFSEREMQSLDRELDPVLVEEGQLFLRQAIEDEMVLLLPIMPMHDSCDNEWIPDPEPGDVLEKKSPFAVLATLKNEQGS